MRSTPIVVGCLLLVGCSATAEVESDTAAQAPTTETPTATPPLTPTTMLSTTTQPTEEPEETTFLDFSAIEGQWSGEAKEVIGFEFWIEATIRSGAEEGLPVGTVRYGLVGLDTADCSGDWLAADADNPVYRIREQITTGRDACAGGNVRLELDAQTGTLRYEFTTSDPNANATGTLTPSE